MHTRPRSLGVSTSLTEPRWVFRTYRRLFGAEDMHSHFRWAAVAPFVDLSSASTLEVGGGDGRISFEVANLGHHGTIVLTELDPTAVAMARATATAGGYSQVEVSQKDLRELCLDATFDQVLAIDVLEHIDDDDRAIDEIAAAMVPHGRLVVSVPTPHFPGVFGRDFADRLGHVRDGYWLEDLAPKLAAAGLTIISHRYHTGRQVSRACRWFYGLGIPYAVGVLWAPLLRTPLLRSDRHVARDEAAGLALVAVKA